MSLRHVRQEYVRTQVAFNSWCTLWISFEGFKHILDNNPSHPHSNQILYMVVSHLIFVTVYLFGPIGYLVTIATCFHHRCPQHKELFRYLCSDDGLYLCADCILEGAHRQHRVRGLKKVEEDLKVSSDPADSHRLLECAQAYLTICVSKNMRCCFFVCACIYTFIISELFAFCIQVTLKGLLQKTQDKIKEGEKILKGHEKTIRTLSVSELRKYKTISHSASFSLCVCQSLGVFV